MRKIVQLLVILSVFSCKKQELPEASLAVEAYIFTGKPIEHIKLNLVTPIESSSDAEHVSNAEVFITWRNRSYQLEENPGIPGTYRLLNDKFEVLSEESYGLLVKYNNEEYTAETTAPKAPAQLASNKDTLNASNILDRININWANQDSTWYLGVIADQDSVTTEFPFNNFFSLPTKSNRIDIAPTDIHSTGDQQFILYGITDDYEKLYRISNSSIGSTNAGNLSNGFGIFAAFSSDTINFVVVDP